jgi:uncharacterized protein YeaO (DUF488 family)
VTRKRKTALRIAEDGEPGAFSSPACYLHEFETPPATTPGVHIKRIHDERSDEDGLRLLVDRLWPRGISKERAALDAWRADLAPSTALRKWFMHDPRRWTEFRQRYRAELRVLAPQLQALRELAASQRVTLLYAARDPRINHAIVLRDALLRTPAAPRRARKS